VRAGVRQPLREPRQRLGAVHEHLDGAAGAWRRVACRPQPSAGRVEGTLPAEPAQTSPMVRPDELLGSVAERLVQGE
jgi:hypothetical protein